MKETINDILNKDVDSHLKDLVLDRITFENETVKPFLVCGIKGVSGCPYFEKTKEYYEFIEDDEELEMTVEFRDNYIFLINRMSESDVLGEPALTLTKKTFTSICENIYSALPLRQRSSHVFKIFEVSEKNYPVAKISCLGVLEYRVVQMIDRLMRKMSDYYLTDDNWITVIREFDDLVQSFETNS
jgi:hypothetical protein